MWMPDERCRVLRRRLARREQQLAHARSRAKNEISAVLQRRLIQRSGFADLFGVAGRRWLAEVELPLEERESVDAGRRSRDLLGLAAASGRPPGRRAARTTPLRCPNPLARAT